MNSSIFRARLDTSKIKMLSPSLSWLDADYIKKVLKVSENEKAIEIKKLTFKLVSDDCLSDLVRASVEFTCGKRRPETKSMIIKIAPNGEDARKDLVIEPGIFEVEIKVLTSTIEKMNAILGEEGYRLNPRTLYTHSGNPSSLVLEDLVPLGFRPVVDQVGLDLDHCILAMRGLAKFHASSLALHEKELIAYEYSNGYLYGDVNPVLRGLFVNGVRSFAKKILGWPELGLSASAYSEKFLRLSDVVAKRCFTSFRPKKDDFNVLNHGDCASWNMLFRYDEENRVVEHIFVDFQTACWTTPLMDILMFLNTSISESVELHHHDLLLTKYHNCLSRTMTKIGCRTKAPEISQLKNVPPALEVLAVVASCVAWPMKTANTSRVEFVNNVVGEKAVNSSIFDDEVMRSKMVRRMQAWDAKGVFDLT